MKFARRHLLKIAFGGAASTALGTRAFAQVAAQPFAQWVEAFCAKALAKSISDATYTRVMSGLKPDTTVFTEIRSQPEFNQQLWQYLNRRVSDWRIQTGQERAKTYAPLLARIEKDFGVGRGVILGLWGIESTFGDPVVKQFGIGLAVAIALDATVVRCMLVPSVMEVLGRRSWYLPTWLDWLPHVEVERPVAPPAPEIG